MKNIKVNIPEFYGNFDPQLYLDWELRIDGVFHLHPTLTEENKVKLATLAFREHASRWWANYCKNRKDEGIPQVNNWTNFKQIMKNRYVPHSHFRDMFNSLNSLKQGSLIVREYYLALEDLIRRSGTRELEENTMTRFIGGLNTEIARPLHLCMYQNLTKLVEYACTVEKDLKTCYL